MALIIIIDLLAVTILCGIALSKGLEPALPFVAFVLTLAPVEAVIPLPGLFGLTTQRLVVIALALLYLLLPGGKSELSSLKTPLKWLILAHVVWCCVSTANSVVPIMSGKKMLSVVLEYYLLYYISFKTVRNKETVTRILFGISAAVIVASVFGAIEAYRNWSIMEWFPSMTHHFSGAADLSQSGRDIRVQSTFGNPILFGGALVVGITCALYLLTRTQRARGRLFLWIGILSMSLCVYKAESRGPWLALVLSYILLLVLGSSQVRRYLAVVGLLTLFVLVIRPGVWATVTNIYYESFDPESPLGSSYDYRYALRHVVVDALAKSPQRGLWGYGMESFYDLHLVGQLEGKPYTFLSCDSAWLELTIETGYVGLLLIAMLLLAPARTAWRDFRQHSGPDRYLDLHLFVCMSVYYFMMLSVGMYSWGQNGYMLWILIAATMATATSKEPKLNKTVSMTDSHTSGSQIRFAHASRKGVICSYAIQRQVIP